jgi:hypothetical protein
LPSSNDYVIDADSLIEIQRRVIPLGKLFEPVLEQISQLCKTRKIIAPEQVKKELKLPSQPKDFRDWMLSNDRMFVKTTDFHVGIVQEIMKKHQNWIKINKTGEWADPFVVALAYGNKNRYLERRKVITCESQTKDTHIPKIAKEYGIESLSLAEFLDNEFSMRLEKK